MVDLNLNAIEKRWSGYSDLRTSHRADVFALIARVRALEAEASEFETEIQAAMSARVDSLGTEKDKRIAELEAALAQVKLDEIDQCTPEWLAENSGPYTPTTEDE